METQWTGRPVLARALRVLLFVAPGIFAWLAVRTLCPLFFQADGAWRLPVWIAQALLVSVIVAKAVGVVAQRLIPLAGLLTLTLVFPDQAPSRFGVALRAGSIRKLQNQAVALPQNEGEAAAAALELVTAFNKHDRLTRGHMERVRAYSEMIGTEMGLPEQDMNRLRWGTLLHDVGKLTVPSEILQKEGRPTSEEWEILRSHPTAGAEMLKPLANFLGPWLGAAGEHHERWDGDGYPNGFAGTEISLAGRICAVADAYDVITSKRSYKEPHSVESARQELVDCSGTHFDPVVVRTFLQAGLRSPARTGFLGWLLELPSTVGLASIPAAIATGAVAAMAFSFNLAPAAGTPESIAFQDQAVEVVESSTTTTTEVPADADTPTTTAVAQIGTATVAPTSAAPTTSVSPTTSTIVPTTSTAAATTTTTRPPTTTTTRPPTTTTAAPQGQLVVLDPNDVGSLAEGQHHGDYAILFKENESVVLSEDVDARFYPTLVEPDDADARELVQGTRVCTWVLRFHPVTGRSPIEFTVDLGREILGETDLGDQIELQHPAVGYVNERPLGGTDALRFDGSRLSARLSDRADGIDEARIFTAC